MKDLDNTHCIRYAKLGMADGKADVQLLQKGEFKSDLDLSYGLGLKSIFYDKQNF